MYLKTVVSCALSVVMVAILSTSVLAETERIEPVDGTDYSNIIVDSDSVNSGFAGALEAREQDIINSRTQESKYINVYAQNDNTRAYWIQLDDMSSFVYYAQELNYSCGPACVKMALKYITGTTYSEATIRTGCNTSTSGTAIDNMKTYINSEQGYNTYETHFRESKTTMKNHLYSGIVACDAPPIVGLQESTSDGWFFNISAHYVAVYSVKSDKSEVAIADPWAGYVSSSSPYKWYDKSTNDVYSAYNAINCGYMY